MTLIGQQPVRGDFLAAARMNSSSSNAGSTWHATEEDFNTVVGAFYDAASGAGAWRTAGDILAQRFSLLGVQVLGVMKANGTAVFSLEGGTVSAEAWLQYITRYHSVNPRIEHCMAIQGDQWFQDQDHFDDQFIARAPFFADFLTPLGIGCASVTKLIDDDEIVVFLGLHRQYSAPALSADEIARLQAIRGHLARAVRMYLRLRQNAQQANTGTTMLDLLPQAVFVVDGTRLVQHANPAGQSRLQSGGVLMNRAGYLVGRRDADDLALVQAIRALGLSGTVSTALSVDRTVARLGRASKGDHCLLFAIAARPDQTMQAFGDKASAIIVAHPLQGVARIDRLVASLAFDLTPAEADVAAALADGSSLNEIAAVRRVSVNTIRIQLRTVFGKMGVTRQSELVRLLRDMPRFGRNPASGARDKPRHLVAVNAGAK